MTISQGKQIAGRAGRFGTKWENGLVTTLGKESLPTLNQYLINNPAELSAAGISPNLDQLERIAHVLPNLPLYKLLQKFEQLATVSGDFFLCKIQQLIEIAYLLETVEMPLREKYVFLQAPVNGKRGDFLTMLLRDFAIAHNAQRTVGTKSIIEGFPSYDPSKLAHLETHHRAIMLYLWLANRYEETFPEIEQARQMKIKVEAAINSLLVTGSDISKNLKIELSGNEKDEVATTPKNRNRSDYEY